jgi:hypothetical protein
MVRTNVFREFVRTDNTSITIPTKFPQLADLITRWKMTSTL